MSVRGIRGATVVDEDNPDQIIHATRELLEAIQSQNPSFEPSEIASIIFTVTADLNSAHPARAARDMGWTDVPMICAQEIPVPNTLPRCIRVLVHWNTPLPQRSIQHIYLREARQLRPDLALRGLGE